MDEKVKIKISDLKFDEKLLSLRKVNKVFVSRYRQAYRSGADMPLIIIDKKTGLIVSGNHRATAIIDEYPADKKIDVIKRAYNDRKDLLFDFAKENSTHGNALDGFTKRKIIFELIKNGATESEIAKVFGISEKRIEIWGNQTAVRKTGKKTTEIVPIKRGPHIEKPMTAEQYEQHVMMDRGITFRGNAKQMVRWLQNGWVLIDDDNIGVAKILSVELKKFIEIATEKIEAVPGN